MSFNDILAQDHVIDHFRKTIKADHLSHAYIFTGLNGVGKTFFAKEFTKALLCKEREADSCNICSNCVKIDKGNHPDIHWIDREEKTKFIKIEDIRNLQNSVRLSPIESDYKFFLIRNAERMNEEASNCLLKTLEEPTPNTIIILIASSLSAVQETIKSRCQIIRFHPIPHHIVKDMLVRNYDAEAAGIGWVSKFCGGSLGNARELVEGNYFEINNTILHRISEQEMNSLAFAEEVLESYLNPDDSLEEKREAIKRILLCVLQYYRDLLMFKVLNERNVQKLKPFLFNEDHEYSLQKMARNLTKENIINLIHDLIMYINYIDYNLNIDLLIENIFTNTIVFKRKK